MNLVELIYFFSFPSGVVDTNIKYDIYFSKQPSGPYQLIDSIYYPDTQYYHSNSDANVSNSYYYLLGTVTCGTLSSGAGDSLLYSDTLSSILMNASPINFGVTADLSWNPIHTLCYLLLQLIMICIILITLMWIIL